MMYDQPDWTWTMALVYIQSVAFTSGHTKYVPDPIEANKATIMYVMFIFVLHIWILSFMTLFVNAILTLIRSIYMTQWAEITDHQLSQLERKFAERKQRRKHDNPKYEN
ncbi:unnamed protein product [Anisakis simplex]|uniref:Ion_trans domain-containing protein n=1 Tax=Anisakis simplex TaxID=6269 RepID=A0A0M3K7X8_ANISI|nr:unnamed protein product [Anisakis simplex]